MMYYGLAVLSGALLGLGIIFPLKRTFFPLSKATLALLNMMLDTSMEETARQKALIQKLKSTLWYLTGFCLSLIATCLVAAVPLYIYINAGYEADLSSGWFYASLGAGSVLPFLLPARKSKNYSAWAVLLHQLILDHYNVARFLYGIDKKLFSKKLRHINENFVVVTGLARAGTTALTQQLYRTEQFHSLSYANMPFLLSVNLWKVFYNPRKNKARQRAHGDNVMFGYQTVEALEEYFFKAFLKDAFITEETLQEHSIDNETYSEYLNYQSLIKPRKQKTTYLAKNNNFMLRYASMRQHNTKFRIVLMFREPLDHARSLLKQHRRFVQLQQEDPFVLEYMNWLAHHEFGLNHKQIVFADVSLSDTLQNKQYTPEDVNYWLLVWINYYNKILALPEDTQLFPVDYADFLRDPTSLMRTLSKRLNMRVVPEVQPFEKPAKQTSGDDADPALMEEANKVYRKLQEYKVV